MWFKQRKNKTKSCFFLDAIRRWSCSRSADWIKIDGRALSVRSRLVGPDATVLFAAPSSSHLHFECLLPLLGSLRKSPKFYASGKFCLLSISLSLSLSAWHLRKKSCPLNTVDPSKSSQSLSSKFILCSLDFAFNLCKSNCAPGREQRRCYGCGIENEAWGSSADWPAPADIAEYMSHPIAGRYPIAVTLHSRHFFNDTHENDCVWALFPIAVSGDHFFTQVCKEILSILSIFFGEAS